MYYRTIKRTKQKQQIAPRVVEMVEKLKMRMPRIGTRKLYYLLYDELKELGMGRDRLFAIMKANHLQVVPKRQYHITTDSRHRFRKHKNLVDGLTVDRPEQVYVSDITYLAIDKIQCIYRW